MIVQINQKEIKYYIQGAIREFLREKHEMYVDQERIEVCGNSLDHFIIEIKEVFNEKNKEYGDGRLLSNESLCGMLNEI